jgi:predicted transcriptional regulator
MVERADDREESQPKPASLARLTTDIVAAYVAHNQVAPADLGTLIGAVEACTTWMMFWALSMSPTLSRTTSPARRPQP